MKAVEEQYWKYGLHDAVITAIECGEMMPNSKNLRYNYLKFTLDAEGALCETNVKEITFYNYTASWKGGKIKDFSYYINCWWIDDVLNKIANKYRLDLELEYENTRQCEHIEITFEQMEVKRK